MKSAAYIKLSVVRLAAGLLIALLFLVSTVRLFHHHEGNLIESPSESEHHNLAESCVICDYILQKHAEYFSSAAILDFKIFAILVYIFLYEIIRKEIKAFEILCSNKAPPQLP